MLGGLLQGSNDWLELRATIMTYTNQRYRSGEPALWFCKNKRDGNFYGFAANADFGNLFVRSELNRLDLDGNLDTVMLTFGYRFNSLTPFISYSAFKQKGGEYGEDHNTTSIGGGGISMPAQHLKFNMMKLKIIQLL